MTDLWQLFGHSTQVEAALHGDLRPLLELLRSDEPLTEAVREYLAREIEKPADKRFRRQKRDDPQVREDDRLLLFRVYSAKIELAMKSLGSDASDDALYEAQDTISDRAALDYLMEHYELEIDVDALKNALRRTRQSIFVPRGPRWRLKWLKAKG